jgi:hypothetical protein
MADEATSPWLLETITSFLRSPSYKVWPSFSFGSLFAFAFDPSAQNFTCQQRCFIVYAHYFAGPDDGIHRHAL